MKKSAWKIVWIVGVYAILVSVLYLVVLYKVKWEDRDLNTYLYFYNCSNNLCTTTTKPNKYYSSVVCKDKVCPYISSMNDNLLVLTTEDKDYVFDYINNKKIHEEYTRYKFTDNKYLIATDAEGKQGIISSVGEVVVPFKYESILNYKDGFVSYISNSRVGIDNDEDNTHIEPKYENVVLLTPNAYAYLNNSVYHIISYDNETPINDNEYDYIYAYNNTILVFRNKQLDILLYICL
jgi:hypothetical protein